MKKLQRFKLNDGEWLVTAYCEKCSGPGWANCPVFVVIGKREGGYRLESIQPQDMSIRMGILKDLSALAHTQMTHAVAQWLRGEK